MGGGVFCRVRVFSGLVIRREKGGVEIKRERVGILSIGCWMLLRIVVNLYIFRFNNGIKFCF